MPPRILWELVADPLRSTEQASGTTALEESAPASSKPLLTKDCGLSSLKDYQPLQLGSFSRC
jgi:hypothetical protein